MEKYKYALMIISARQIGKIYIIKEFCEKEFEKSIYINLLNNVFGYFVN